MLLLIRRFVIKGLVCMAIMCLFSVVYVYRLCGWPSIPYRMCSLLAIKLCNRYRNNKWLAPSYPCLEFSKLRSLHPCRGKEPVDVSIVRHCYQTLSENRNRRTIILGWALGLFTFHLMEKKCFFLFEKLTQA